MKQPSEALLKKILAAGKAGNRDLKAFEAMATQACEEKFSYAVHGTTYDVGALGTYRHFGGVAVDSRNKEQTHFRIECFEVGPAVGAATGGFWGVINELKDKEEICYLQSQTQILVDFGPGVYALYRGYPNDEDYLGTILVFTGGAALNIGGRGAGRLRIKRRDR